MNPANANLAGLLVERAADMADRPAICSVRGKRERQVSFAELERLSARGAALLHARGLRAGDAVLIFQPVSVELYVALLAVFRLGLTAMFVDPSAGRAHLARCCELVRPRGFLGPPKAHLLRLVCGALRRIEVNLVTGMRLPLPGTVPWDSLLMPSPREPIVEATPETPALLTFTSGSTGLPKASVRTHGFLRSQHRALAESLRLAPGETDLATLPIFVLANLASGVTSLLPDADLRHPGRIDARPVARQIVRHRPTRTVASPAFLERLLDADVPLEGFQQIYTGGAPVFPHLLARLRTAAGPSAEIAAVYGSTEAEPMARLSERDITGADRAAILDGRGLPAGCPVPSVRLCVIGDRWGEPLGSLTAESFAAMACAPGAAGEIVVTGEHVLKGYLHGEGDAETKFRVEGETWHRTGDAGTLEADGRLWLLGRCAARVGKGHGTIYPLAIEAAAQLAAPWMRRCALLDWRGGRWLLVEGRGRPPTGGEQGELAAALAWAGLAGVRAVPEIPVDRRHNAKIDYVALREKFGK